MGLSSVDSPPDGTESNLDLVTAGLPVVFYRYVVARDGVHRLERVSATIEDFTGRSPAWFEEDLPRAFSCIHEEDRAAVREASERSVADRSDLKCEYRMRHLNGSVRWVRHHGVYRGPGPDDSFFWNVLITDVEERKQLEAQLQMADRLSSVGALAAAVAHEINNPLAYVQGNVAVAYERIGALRAGPTRGDEKGVGGVAVAGDDDALGMAHVALTDALEGCARMRDTVADLRAFARSDRADDEIVDVQRVLDMAVRMTRNDVRHRARLVENRGAVPPVRGSEAKLAQVFVNLMVNAVQALPNRDSTLNEIAITTSLSDGMVLVEVHDNGTGIAPEHRDRIFEPFFTTKPRGVGNGLGLSVCLGIVHSLGGRIEVSSAPARGSTFGVRLPPAPALAPNAQPRRTRSQPDYVPYQPSHSLPWTAVFHGPHTPPSSPAPAALASPRATPTSGATRPTVPERAREDRSRAASNEPRARVLIIDDEPLLLAAVQRMLGREFDVTALPGGREAVALLCAAEPSVHFDLILCDLMMPAVSGRDVYDVLVSERPDLLNGFYLLTGGAFVPGLDSFAELLGDRVLTKPVSLPDLRALARRHRQGAA